METEITKLIKECEELIEVYHSPVRKMDLKDLQRKLEDLISLSKEKYPLFCEELENAISMFNQNRSYYMRRISRMLSLMEKEEKGINQKTKENKTSKQVLFWTIIGVVVAVIIGIISNWEKIFG